MEVDPKFSLNAHNLVEGVHEEGLASPHSTPEVDTSRYGGMNKNAGKATTALSFVMLPVRGAAFESGKPSTLSCVKYLPLCS
jgi:hypothetical protein